MSTPSPAEAKPHADPPNATGTADDPSDPPPGDGTSPTGDSPRRPLTTTQTAVLNLLQMEDRRSGCHEGWLDRYGYRPPGDRGGRLPNTPAELAAMCRAAVNGDPTRAGLGLLGVVKLYRDLQHTAEGRRVADVVITQTVTRMYQMALAFGRPGDLRPDPPHADGIASAPLALLRLADWCDRRAESINDDPDEDSILVALLVLKAVNEDSGKQQKDVAKQLEVKPNTLKRPFAKLKQDEQLTGTKAGSASKTWLTAAGRQRAESVRRDRSVPT